MAQPQNQGPYHGMKVREQLRPTLHRVGFRNLTMFSRAQLIRMCEEFDRVHGVRISDLHDDFEPSEEMVQTRTNIYDSMRRENAPNSASTTTARSSSRTSTKRKQTETAESPKEKRQKVFKGRKGSDAEDSNGETGARHVSKKGNVSETNAQAGEAKTTQNTYETRKQPSRSAKLSSRSGDPTPTSGTSTTTKTSKAVKKSVAPKTAKQSAASKATKQPAAPKTVKRTAAPRVPKRPAAPVRAKKSVASNVKSGQEATRISARNKKPMDTSQPSDGESRNPQTEMSEPTVSLAKDTSAPAANPSSATERSEVQNDGEPEDSGDDSDDSSDESEHDGEDNSDDSDEEQRPSSIPKSPARRTPHNLHLGTHRTFRYEPRWDPLDERIPTSSLNWFEQVQRQRAMQAQLRSEAKVESSSEEEPKTIRK